MESREHQESMVQKARGELREMIAGGHDAYFAGINTDRLEDEDIEIYRKLSEGTLSQEELVRWRDKVFAGESERPKADTDEPVLKSHSDRGNFAAWMVNAFGELQLKRLTENEQS